MLRSLFVAALSCGVLSAAGAQTVRLKAVRAEAVRIRPNLLVNYSFEEAGPNGIPTGWQWDRRNTDATCAVDTQTAHSGRRSIKLTNGTPFGAHVYGMLWRDAPIRLEVGKPYTLSAWVRSEEPGSVGLITGSGWQFRVYAPATGREWRRVWTTFTPGEGDRDCVVRISTESPTKGVWIDDLKLEEGTEPTPVEPAGGESAPLQLYAATPETEIQGDGEFGVSFLLFTPRAFTGTTEATLAWKQKDAEIISREIVKRKQLLKIPPGAWRLVLTGSSEAADDAPRVVTLRLTGNGEEVARAEAKLRFYSPTYVLNRLKSIRSILPSIKKGLANTKAQHIDISYPIVTYTVLENFVNYAEEDVRKREIKRALMQTDDMESMMWPLALVSFERSDQYLSIIGKYLSLNSVPRWTGDKRPIVRGSSFIAPARLPGKKSVERPIFFNGYGHFGQVVADMEKWPGYGTNIIQIEVGPSVVFPAEDRVNDAPVRGLLQTLDRAKKAGVAVCLLISPHYMPGWALEKWPHLKKRRDGFLQYCLHAPEGQALLKRFLATLIPPIKDHPALHSICLSNEPVNVEEPCEYAAREWHEWLRKRHGDVATLNARWGTRYASLDDAPLPNPFGTRPAQPVWMDHIRFNEEFFAGWHRMLADAIHAIAPDLPVHAKAMTWTLLNDSDVIYGVDATLFGQFSQINGNDAVNWYTFGGGEWAQGWQQNAMGHDLQRSVLDAPVFNSENHIIMDRDTRYVPPEHVRAALWQAAAHGQSATTIWVWERAFDPKSDFAGSIMHRPACAEAVGRVNLDLNRAAYEMTAIQQAAPQVLLLQSATASVWDFGRYGDCLGKLYTALSFTGLKIGFVTERQLEERPTPSAPILFIPNMTHLSDAAFRALTRYKGRIVFAGEGDLLTQNDYGQPRTERLAGEQVKYRYGPTQWRDLWKSLLVKLPAWGVRPAVELREGNLPAWGVEWRSAQMSGGTVVNLCNYRHDAARLTLVRDGRPVPATDVLTGERIKGALTLKPLEVRLLCLSAGR